MNLRQPSKKELYIEKTVPLETMHRRLDQYLTETNIGFTRSKIQRLIRNGDVSVNSITIKKSGHHIIPDDIISICIPESRPVSATPEAIPLDIVYEDEFLLVVNKPAGMVVHPACGNWTSTLVNALLYHCHNLSNIGGDIRPGIVHRLDKDTSGLLVVAKRDEVHVALSEQLSERKMSRKYIAFAWGHPKKKSGAIEAVIGRHPTHRQSMAVVEANRGRHAITHYQIEKELPECSILSLRLETGRTHQIRVHLAHIGFPIVGDPVYGDRTKWISRLSPSRRRTAQSVLDLLHRQALHAATLGFFHPVSGERLEFQAPLPEDMCNVITYLEG